MTSLSPAVTLTLIRQPWDLCPDITLSKVHIPCKFREILITGRWSKIPDERAQWSYVTWYCVTVACVTSHISTENEISHTKY